MLELLQYQFVQNAMVSLFLISAVCAVIGTFIVVKRISYIAGGIAHISFGGIGLGYFLGIDPIISAMPFTVICAIIIGVINKMTKIGEDIAIGIFWSLGMALGIVLIFLTPGYAPDLFSYLFGNILAVPPSELVILFILDVIVLIVTLMFFEHFKAVSFDETFAQVRGVKTNFFYLLLLVLISLSVIMLIKIIGVILVIAFLTMPASIAKQYSNNLHKLMIISAIICILAGLGGFWLSYYVNLPTGASIVLLLGILFAISSGFSHMGRYFRGHPLLQ